MLDLRNAGLMAYDDWMASSGRRVWRVLEDSGRPPTGMSSAVLRPFCAEEDLDIPHNGTDVCDEKGSPTEEDASDS